MREKRILHLTLKKQFFDAILCGEKTVEYREKKPYWVTRLKGKTFDEIHFRNGYAKDAPTMVVEWKGISTVQRNNKQHYAIQFGTIIKTKNV